MLISSQLLLSMILRISATSPYRSVMVIFRVFIRRGMAGGRSSSMMVLERRPWEYPRSWLYRNPE